MTLPNKRNMRSRLSVFPSTNRHSESELEELEELDELEDELELEYIMDEQRIPR